MKDTYYLLRGWDEKTGLQKRQKLESLSLSEIIPELERHNLLATD
jgi:aldehyde:ferredoxin oxidoreductase